MNAQVQCANFSTEWKEDVQGSTRLQKIQWAANLEHDHPHHHLHSPPRSPRPQEPKDEDSPSKDLEEDTPTPVTVVKRIENHRRDIPVKSVLKVRGGEGKPQINIILQAPKQESS